MKTLESIKKRRSIRTYEKGRIPRETIQILLEAAMYAPSARNEQPWQFMVVDDPAVLRELAEAHPYGKMLAEAGAAILVCGDKTMQENESYLLQNCSAATQNILLAAHELGLGTVWLGIQPREQRVDAVRRILRLPSHIFPVSLVSIGKPAEVRDTPQRFKKERIHYNEWQGEIKKDNGSPVGFA
ncbi:MAG: nitroreductase family protein [Bacteroidales bacterium]